MGSKVTPPKLMMAKHPQRGPFRPERSARKALCAKSLRGRGHFILLNYLTPLRYTGHFVSLPLGIALDNTADLHIQIGISWL